MGRQDVASLGPEETIWDPDLAGFGARRRGGDAISYFLMYRNAHGVKRRYTIGRDGAPWVPDTARKEAKRILALVAKGEDPAGTKTAWREAPTLSEVCDVYLRDAEAGRLLTRKGVAKKATTLTTDRSRIEAHIKPLLGKHKAAGLTRRDVQRFMADVMEGRGARRVATGKTRGLSNVRGGAGAAARTMGLLGAIFAYAVEQGIRTDNPVRGVVRPADGKRERRLSNQEYAALGATLRLLAEPPPPRKDGKAARNPIWLHAVTATRFLALSGWRLGEALNLRWRDVDLATRTARLTDTKTGASVRPLAHPMVDLLNRQRTLVPHGGEDRVFPPSRGEGGMAGFPKLLAKIMEKANLADELTAHVLRHSAASVGGDLGLSELAIGAVLGHRGGTVTSRYIHAADGVILQAADAIAVSVAHRMGDAQPSGTLVAFTKAGAA
jgi:integrase